MGGIDGNVHSLRVHGAVEAMGRVAACAVDGDAFIVTVERLDLVAEHRVSGPRAPLVCGFPWGVIVSVSEAESHLSRRPPC